MTIDFKALKSNRGDQLEKLTNAVNALNPQYTKDSDIFWYPAVDKAGNGHAIFRFLPAPKAEDVPFVRWWDHGFKGPGGWYIEKSRTSIGEKDPLTEYNAELWATEEKAKREFVTKFSKRKLRYASNVLVIKHTARSEDEGQVKLFRYGKKIFDMIQDKMHPQFEDEKPIIPFDFWEGANFNMKIRKVDGFPNYDKSTFSESGPLSDNDEELEAIWNQCKSLQTFTDPKNYKSYDDLQKRMNMVFKLGSAPAATPARAASRPVADAGEDVQEDVPTQATTTDDDGADFFANLRDKG